MMMMTVMTILAALLTFENFHISGKMILIYFSLCLTKLLMELFDCTILIGNDNDENIFELHENLTFYDSSTVESCGNSFSGYNAYSRSSYHSKLPNSSG